MQEHNDWLQFAEYDLRAARAILNSNDPAIPPALVLSQQCAEKALKAYLFFKRHKLIKTHDLTQLVDVCKQYDHHFNELEEAAGDLVPHITTSRYPDSCFIMPDLTTAEILLDKAQFIYDFVKQKIN